VDGIRLIDDVHQDFHIDGRTKASEDHVALSIQMVFGLRLFPAWSSLLGWIPDNLATHLHCADTRLSGADTLGCVNQSIPKGKLEVQRHSRPEQVPSVV